MKMIGLIGGMTWESTVIYYQLINRSSRDQLGGLHSARCLLWSFDFAEIEADQAKGDWDTATEKMIGAAKSLELAGADCIVICTNTMHKMASAIEENISIPLIHIADATATAIKGSAAKNPLLLGTRYTMEQDFYKGHLKSKHDIQTLIPNDSDRTLIHDIIYDELGKGIVTAASKQVYLDVIQRAIEQGADGVILGCTEITLLVNQDDLDIPVFDTTFLHAKASLEFALS